MSDENTQKSVDDFVPRRKMSDLLSSLDDLENSPVVLASSIADEEDAKREAEAAAAPAEDEIPKRKTASKYNMFVERDDDEASWISAISRVPKLKPKKHGIKDIYDVDGKKKKKKKGGADGDTELTDFEQEYSKEMAVLQHLLVTQNEFVEKLQQQYDQQTANKSPVRGVGKYQTDLISNINSARSLSKDLIKEIINTKKTIADLAMKEKKEYGLAGGSVENMGEYASGFLKQLLNVDRRVLDGVGSADVEDMDLGSLNTNDLNEMFSARGDFQGRTDEAMQYLKYENQHVKVKCLLHSDGSYDFAAFNADDELVDDYPLPSNDMSLSINKSTMKARDEFGVNYDIIELDD